MSETKDCCGEDIRIECDCDRPHDRRAAPPGRQPPEPTPRQALIRRLCQLQAEVCEQWLGYTHAADCFCGEEGYWPHGATEADFRNEGKAVAFIEEATRAALRAASGGAPAGTGDAVTPQEREREAREDIRDLMDCLADITHIGQCECEQRLDAYRSAVEARVRWEQQADAEGYDIRGRLST